MCCHIIFPLYHIGVALPMNFYSDKFHVLLTCYAIFFPVVLCSQGQTHSGWRNREFAL